jgi:uncharacterized protein YbjT (DUF2867 family)
MSNNRRVLIIGGGTFLGGNIAAALLAEGGEVTLLVRPGGEANAGPLLPHVRWQVADVWDLASLRGRARGCDTVIHTVGSLVADPAQGLTHHRMNFVSARNVATMCVSDGVRHMILMSSVNAPWMSGRYVHAKREAEDYLERVGVNGTIIRAPLVYTRGQKRPLFFEFMTLLGHTPPFMWTQIGRIAPMPVDVLARGVARIALNPTRAKSIYYSRDLWRLNTKEERSFRTSIGLPLLPDAASDGPKSVHPFKMLDEDIPFGWRPPDE